MAEQLGRKGSIGIGVETTPGTAVDPTHWFYEVEASTIKPMETYIPIPDGQGRVEEMLKHKPGQRWGEGDTTIGLDPTNSVHMFVAILGSISSTTAAGEATVYEHTITVSNNTIPAKTYTLSETVGDTFEDAYTQATCNSVEISVSDGRATAVANWISNTAASDTETPSYTDTTMFIFSDYTIKFGATIGAVGSAVPVNEFTLTIARNAEARFASGSRDPRTITQKQLQITGSYTLDLDASTERDVYTGGSPRAILIQFTGESIGNTETEEIRIELPQCSSTEWDMPRSLDDLDTETATFTAEYDDTTDDRSIYIVVTNQDDVNNY